MSSYIYELLRCDAYVNKSKKLNDFHYVNIISTVQYIEKCNRIDERIPIFVWFWFFICKFYQLKIWKCINVDIYSMKGYGNVSDFIISDVSMERIKLTKWSIPSETNTPCISDYLIEQFYLHYNSSHRKHIYRVCMNEYAGNYRWSNLCGCMNGLRRCKLYVITSGVTKIKICMQTNIIYRNTDN